MAVRVRLSDGVRFIVNADINDFAKSYQEALKKNELLEVENGNGKTRVLNPQQILYFENHEPSAEDAEEDPILRAADQAPR